MEAQDDEEGEEIIAGELFCSLPFIFCSGKNKVAVILKTRRFDIIDSAVTDKTFQFCTAFTADDAYIKNTIA